MRFRRKKSESDEDSAQEESAVKSRLYGTAEPEARDWEDGLEEQVVAPERETFVDPTRNIYALRKEREQTRAETAKNSIPHEAEPAAESIPAAQLPTQGEKEGVDAFIEKTMKQLEEEAACKLFIGGLSYECTEELLLEKFSEHGDVVSAHIATRTDDDGAKASRGFGFVTYKHRDDAEAAIQELNRSQLMKRSLTVKKQEVSEEQMKNQLLRKLKLAGFVDNHNTNNNTARNTRRAERRGTGSPESCERPARRESRDRTQRRSETGRDRRESPHERQRHHSREPQRRESRERQRRMHSRERRHDSRDRPQRHNSRERRRDSRERPQRRDSRDCRRQSDSRPSRDRDTHHQRERRDSRDRHHRDRRSDRDRPERHDSHAHKARTRRHRSASSEQSPVRDARSRRSDRKTSDRKPRHDSSSDAGTPRPTKRHRSPSSSSDRRPKKKERKEKKQKKSKKERRMDSLDSQEARDLELAMSAGLLDEKQHDAEETQEVAVPAAPAARPPREEERCYNCHEKGHKAFACPKKSKLQRLAY